VLPFFVAERLLLALIMFIDTSGTLSVFGLVTKVRFTSFRILEVIIFELVLFIGTGTFSVLKIALLLVKGEMF